jgi:signal transduction histidine kinase
MGLGVYLTRNVLERLGGDLQLDSEVGAGTTATLRIPRSV